MESKPIAAGLFTWPDDAPRLIANKCRHCAAITFPVRLGCSRCGKTEFDRELLANQGTLWTWTSQGFLPKPPFAGNLWAGAEFSPWFVGVIELVGQLRVETLLIGVTEETLKIGMGMRMVAVPFSDDEVGGTTVTFAFTPDVHKQDSTKDLVVASA